MKASDISDEAFLDVVWRLNGDEGKWAFMWDVQERFPEVPEKVLLAKARKLIRRGLMDGCYCGCRGDFVVR